MHKPMNEKYFPNEIEPRWQRHWAEENTFHVEIEPGKPKFYCLEMLAYTSGKAHMGHVRNYAIGDALAWYKRLRGLSVMHPFGWDAFGQPAENAAIKDGTEPEKFTRDSIANMKRQLQRVGLSYDWSREIASCDPEYYKWNQWFFIRMWERGMLYRKLAPVNWCPKENISLSNEQAAGGTCWRCDTPVIQKELMQWFARITDYAEELLRSLDQLEGGWPERVIAMQRNWIGRSAGAEVTFKVADIDASVTVFTTRIDTIYGANAIVLAPEHPLVTQVLEANPRRGEIVEFAERLKAQQRSGRALEELDKEGIFTGVFAINPFGGEKLSIWIANFVLMGYGTGAVMAVPAGDQRDFEFSKKYGLPFRQIKLTLDGREIPASELDAADEEWTVTVNTGQWSGLPSIEANTQMTQYAQDHGFGRGSVKYKLRDWGISRQRFWGTPIPMIHCGACGIVPVPDDQLPVVLPTNVNLKVEGGSPLDHVPEFVHVKCPKCGGDARRDTDTMDTFVDSNWYYYRYCDPHNDAAPFDGAKIEYWLPVDQYIGGVEHAVLHLIYTRYWTKVMRDLGLIKLDEPITRLLTQGMVCMQTYKCPEHEWLFPDQVSDQNTCLICGKPVEVGRIEKMSKTKRNVVDPDKMIDRYGADSLRIFVLFASPPEKDMEWVESGIEGASKYLQRVWRMAHKWQVRIRDSISGSYQLPLDPSQYVDYQRKLRRRAHQVIRSITENMEDRMHLNTCISSLMELTNEIYAFDQAVERSSGTSDTDRAIMRESFEALVKMLAPFAPHICEEIWQAFGHDEGLTKAIWPSYIPELTAEEEIEVPVQVNGKLKGRVYVSAAASEEEIKSLALNEEKVRAAIEGKDIVKVIVVPKKLVNVVVK
jgi:leucyl-tRNA synthetase